ncbi:MAG: ExbD/TolR family protein, partial [Bryobacteraceae bacterium]
VMEFGFEVDVPKVREVRQSVEDLPVVALTRQGELYLNEKPVNINALGDEIKRRFPQSQSAYVRADKETVYDPLAQVISRLHEAGIKVNLVTQPADSGDTAGK